MRDKVLNFANASETQQSHRREIRLPEVVSLQNMVPTSSDGVPSLRPDLTPETEPLLALEIPDVEEALVGAVEARGTGTVIYVSSIPFWIDGSTPTSLCSTYTNGTVTGTAGTSAIKFSIGDMRTLAWPGCILVVGSNIHQITAITDDDDVVIGDEVPVGGYSGETFVLYRCHRMQDALTPVNAAHFVNSMVYQVENPLRVTDKDNIAGPWQNLISVPNYDWTWYGYLPSGTQIGIYRLNSVWLYRTSTAVYYASDPTGSWSSASVANPMDLMWDGTQYLTCNFSGKIFQTTGSDLSSWTEKEDVAATLWGICWNGADTYVAVGVSGVIYTADSGDLTTWTSQTSGVTKSLFAARWSDYGYYFVCGYNTILRSEDGVTWGDVTPSSISATYLTSIATSGSINIAAGYSGSAPKMYRSINDGATWTEISCPVTGPIMQVVWSGTYFVACSTYGDIVISEDGSVWIGLENPSTYLYGCAPSDTSLTNMLCIGYDGAKKILYGVPSTSDEIVIDEFYPMSETIRAVSFAVAGVYGCMVGVVEWDTNASKWIYNPRKIMYSVPGTLRNFTGLLSGYYNCPGTGRLRNSKALGENIIINECGGVGVLRQLGDPYNPWAYELISEGLRSISNFCSVENLMWFVGSDGRLYSTDGSGADKIGPLDITAHIDPAPTTPVCLSYSSQLRSLVVWVKSTSAPHTVYLVGESTGSVTSIILPELVDGETTLVPRMVFGSEVPGDTKLYISYGPHSDDTDRIVAAYLDVGEVIKGVDVVYSGQTDRWHAEIVTGFESLLGDNQRSTVRRFLLETFTDGASSHVRPHVALLVRGLQDTTWRGCGDPHATITVGTSSCTLTGSAASNRCGEGDDANKVFTTPVQATRCRIYHEVSGVETELTLGTDFTVTDTYEITLAAGYTAPSTSEYINAYWHGEPFVKMATGDLVLTDEGVHRITAIPDAWTLTLSWYPSAETTGTHLKAHQLDDDESSLVLGSGQLVDRMQARVIVAPRNDANASTTAQVASAIVLYDPQGGIKTR